MKWLCRLRWRCRWRARAGGRWTAGQIRWTRDLPSWLSPPGDQIFGVAFGDPYVKGQCNAEGFCNQPVYMVNAEGDTISVQALAGATSGLVVWNPQTGAHVSLRGPQWPPDDHVLRIELDQIVSPPTLHVATWVGAAAIRKLP